MTTSQVSPGDPASTPDYRHKAFLVSSSSQYFLSSFPLLAKVLHLPPVLIFRITTFCSGMPPLEGRIIGTFGPKNFSAIMLLPGMANPLVCIHRYRRVRPKPPSTVVSNLRIRCPDPG
ncbi:hypothetical protein J6590_070066 [Homalodisca vitripennis]|nr:hypothetical protein J6590_070066 [Homalodisca vitripennis]